jgi:hypothetical protein
MQNAQQPRQGQGQQMQNAQQPPRQGETQPMQNAQQPAQGQGQAQQPATQQGQAQQPGAGQTQTGQNAQQNPQSQQGVVSLDAQQNTRVSQAIRQANVRAVSNVNFSLAVGTAVPTSVQLHALPSALVEVVPQYRGYSFFVVEQQAVIVDPGTHEIVAMIPFEASTSGQASAAPSAAPAQSRKSLELTREQREVLRKHAAQRRTTTTTERRTTTGQATVRPRVGERLPDSMEIESFPEDVYREVPAVRGYRYYGTERGLLLVDPAERGVIEDIE